MGSEETNISVQFAQQTAIHFINLKNNSATTSLL